MLSEGDARCEGDVPYQNNMVYEHTTPDNVMSKDPQWCMMHDSAETCHNTKPTDSHTTTTLVLAQRTKVVRPAWSTTKRMIHR